jgi:hypothetical protein
MPCQRVRTRAVLSGDLGRVDGRMKGERCERPQPESELAAKAKTWDQRYFLLNISLASSWCRFCNFMTR